jgi:hypothetical protein
MPNAIVRTGLATALLGAVAAVPARAAHIYPYIVEVTDVTAHVGEHAVMHIILRPREGYRVLDAYRNQLSRFSSLDGKVAFDNPSVAGTEENGTLVFTVGVTPTAPGRHPINGVFRVGYIEDPSSMSMISVPLIANVIGRE